MLTAPDTLSVSQLTAQIKQLLEQGFSRVRVSGEVSRLTARAGGHIYFTIKDANAALAAVIWKSTALRLAVQPEESGQYTFHGHLSLFPPQGRYQLVVSRIEAEGGGALAAEFERRKRVFAERGWFAADHKLSLPALPRHIGIVTSDTAAALHDVRKVLSTRPAWLHLTLAPTVVQGPAAPAGIVRALQMLQAMPEPPDIILLVRGGGSPEDLWCFNDEQVVRSIFECSIPVISGIGHDIDITLADFAADLHAATPSNAAEMACPASESLRKQMPRLTMLRQMVQHRLIYARQSSRQAAESLEHRWQTGLDERRMFIERIQHQIDSSSRHLLQEQKQRLRVLEKRLLSHEPGQRLRLRQRHLDESMQRLHKAAEKRDQQSARNLEHVRQSMLLLKTNLMAQARRRLELQNGQLHALGPHSVLKRGYSITLTPDGRILRSILQMKPDDRLLIRLHDGTANARVQDTQIDGASRK